MHIHRGSNLFHFGYTISPFIINNRKPLNVLLSPNNLRAIPLWSLFNFQSDYHTKRLTN